MRDKRLFEGMSELEELSSRLAGSACIGWETRGSLRRDT